MRQFVLILCLLNLFLTFVDSLPRESELTLDYKTAEELASLPLECYNKEFPYKSSIVFNGIQDVQVKFLKAFVIKSCFDKN